MRSSSRATHEPPLTKPLGKLSECDQSLRRARFHVERDAVPAGLCGSA